MRASRRRGPLAHEGPGSRDFDAEGSAVKAGRASQARTLAVRRRRQIQEYWMDQTSGGPVARWAGTDRSGRAAAAITPRAWFSDLMLAACGSAL